MVFQQNLLEKAYFIAKMSGLAMKRILDAKQEVLETSIKTVMNAFVRSLLYSLG